MKVSFLIFCFCVFFFLEVVSKTPEGGRSFLGQVEERIISALEDRTRDRGKGLG